MVQVTLRTLGTHPCNFVSIEFLISDFAGNDKKNDASLFPSRQLDRRIQGEKKLDHLVAIFVIARARVERASSACQFQLNLSD